MGGTVKNVCVTFPIFFCSDFLRMLPEENLANDMHWFILVMWLKDGYSALSYALHVFTQ